MVSEPSKTEDKDIVDSHWQNRVPLDLPFLLVLPDSLTAIVLILVLPVIVLDILDIVLVLSVIVLDILDLVLICGSVFCLVFWEGNFFAVIALSVSVGRQFVVRLAICNFGKQFVLANSVILAICDLFCWQKLVICVLPCLLIGFLFLPILVLVFLLAEFAISFVWSDCFLVGWQLFCSVFCLWSILISENRETNLYLLFWSDLPSLLHQSLFADLFSSWRMSEIAETIAIAPSEEIVQPQQPG